MPDLNKDLRKLNRLELLQLLLHVIEENERLSAEMTASSGVQLQSALAQEGAANLAVADEAATCAPASDVLVDQAQIQEQVQVQARVQDQQHQEEE